MFLISFNTFTNRNRTLNNKRVKRARLKLVDEKNDSTQKNNDDEKSASRERLIKNDDNDEMNNVEKKPKMMIISMRIPHAIMLMRIHLIKN